MEENTKLARIEERLDKQLVSTVRFGKSSLTITTMGEAMEFAKIMALSKQMIRKDFRGNPEMCLAVCIQAHEWGLNPYAVASKAFIVNDMVSYESQLIHAVIETRAPLKGRLRSEFAGEGDERKCRVYGTFNGETEPHEYVSPKFRNINPKNSPLWKSDPDQQQVYYSTRAWARRHCPDVIMGIYTPEEAQTIDMENAPQGWKSVDNPMGDDPKVIEIERKNGKRDPYPDAKAHLKTEGAPADPVLDAATPDEAIEARMAEARKPAQEAEDHDQETGEVRDREAEEEQEGREAAAEEVQEAPEEPKEPSKPVQATPEPARAKNAPAKAQDAPTTTSAGYFQDALATIANAVDGGKLNTWWRGDRQKRLKECSVGELEQLNDAYSNKFIALSKE